MANIKTNQITHVMLRRQRPTRSSSQEKIETGEDDDETDNVLKAMSIKKMYQNVNTQSSQILRNIDEEASWVWAKDGHDHIKLNSLSGELKAKSTPFAKKTS